MKRIQWEVAGTLLAQEIDSAVVEQGCIKIWYLGQCGFIIKSATATIAIDLILSELYDAEGNIRRRYAPPFAAHEAPQLTHLLCSHSHADHMDIPTIAGILEYQPNVKCIIPKGISNLVASFAQDRFIFAVQNEPVAWDAECSILPIQVAHETFETDSDGNSEFLGYFISYGEDITLFHSGDAVLESSIRSFAQSQAPIDVVMFPVNGTDAQRKQAGIIGNMDSHDAVDLAVDADAALAIPMHFDMFTINGADPQEFVDRANEIGTSFAIWVPQLGLSKTVCKQS